MDIYELDNLKELAEQFVDEGLYWEIPKAIANYLDYDAIAHDLGFDYSETTIAGKRLFTDAPETDEGRCRQIPAAAFAKYSLRR